MQYLKRTVMDYIAPSLDAEKRDQYMEKKLERVGVKKTNEVNAEDKRRTQSLGYLAAK